MNIGFDIIFLAVIAVATLASFFLGEEKSQRLMIGVLVGGLAANMLSPLVIKFIPQSLPLGGNLLGIIFMSACVAASVAGKNVRDNKWPKSKFKALVAGFLSGIGGLSLVIASLPDEARNQLITEYNLASLAYDLRLFTVGALIIWLLVSYLTVGKAKK